MAGDAARESAGSGPAAAEAPANPDSALAQALSAIEGEPLGLADAIRTAHGHSTSLRQAEDAYDAAAAAARRERGAFDPELYGEASRIGADQPSSSPFSGASVLTSRQTGIAAGARMKLSTGLKIDAGVNTTRQETNSALTTVMPQYTASGVLQVTQPLLKGFGPAAHDRLSSAEAGLTAARARRDDAALALEADVESGYWDLYAAERDLAVQRIVRDRARSLLTEAETRARAGLVGPNQPANARVFVAEQEQAVLDREEALDAASDRLGSLIGRAPEGARFRPVDEPAAQFAVPDADSLVALAEARNLELRARESEVRANRALEAGARWNALPALDLFGSIGSNGLTGTGRSVVFGQDTLRTVMQGGYGDLLGQISGRDYPTWNAGLRFTVPLGLRAGSAERRRTAAEVRRSASQLEASRRALADDVRANQRELANGARRLSLARMGVEASLEQVRIGVLEYRNGRSTAFELVRLGADLASAQQRYSQALVRTARAAAQLRRLTAGGYPGTKSETGIEGGSR